ncbi:PWWP domain-containing DNA repair factor 3B-like isoform X2 [Ylistrum balloti]|uniref:PWWP domain-containing DNA repair factor 3B-like isoform X2 n=1 Tax=Ylistrum balloti TaxID=509963 RepID=UPI002905A26E|nr:PWWP domain-containing DNA repair factor 3B-like isoform X2 [Ylistrum balloti]
MKMPNITDMRLIRRLDCLEGELFTQKGLSMRSYSEAFKAAVLLAEKECGLSLLCKQQKVECSKKRKLDNQDQKRVQHSKKFVEETPSRKTHVLPNFESDSSPDLLTEVNTEPSKNSLKAGQSKITFKKVNCSRTMKSCQNSSKDLKLTCMGSHDGLSSPLRESVSVYTSDYGSSPGMPLSPMSNLNGSSCSFDLPTPTPVDRSLPHSSRLSFDPNLEKDLCDSSDSDFELPDGLSPIVGGPAFSEKDIILIRWRKHPFWPAYVKKIYQKRQQFSKISVIFIKPMKNTPLEKITMRYRRKSVLPFNEKEKKKILDNLQEENSSQFSMACELAEDYLDKKVLGRWKKGIPGHPDMCESDSEDEKVPDIDYGPPISDSASENLSVSGDMQPLDDLTNPKDQERYEKMKTMNENLIAYIKSEEMKKYLVQIYLGKKKSERHTMYFSDRTKEKSAIRHAGFGPIADEEQQDDIINTLMKWHQEVNGQSPDQLPSYDYVVDVWIPEAIIQGLVKSKGYRRGKAMEKFAKGVKLSKVERDRLHRSLIDNAKNISKEDWTNHEEKRNIQLKKLGINIPYRRPAKLVKL